MLLSDFLTDNFHDARGQDLVITLRQLIDLSQRKPRAT